MDMADAFIAERALRCVALYRALAHANRAMLRGGSVERLCRDVCEACVRHGQAMLAGLWDFDGTRLVLRAAAGPVAARFGTTAPAWPLDEAPPVAAPLVAALRSGRTQRGSRGGVPIVVPLRRGDGVTGVLALHLADDEWPDAECIALAEEIAQDIAFALENLDRDRALREREQQLADIVETATDAIITIDGTHRIRVFNRAACRMFRVDAADAIGAPLDRFVPEMARARHGAHVDRFARTGGHARPMGAMHAVRGRRADGEVFPIEASISQVSAGEGVLMTAVVRDLTAAHEAEQARAAQVAAEAASRAKSDFISRLSHELRTPLNAVLGCVQLLADDPAVAADARLREILGQARQAGWHLLDLIDDLLDVAGIEAGRLRVQPTDLALGPVLQAALDVLAPQAREHGVGLAAPAPDATLKVRADAARLRQVLINLLSNAVKYNRPGGHAAIEVAREAGRACITVADDGQGIAPEQCRHLFEPFNRLGREHGSVPGSGLGLALSRQLVQAMGGDIEIESRLEAGTRVHVRLPLADQAAASGPGPAARPAASVLYIEDNAVNLLLVQQFLARWPGVHLHAATTGAEGLAQARALQPDLVLLDMHLPDIDGLAVLQALRADPATRAMPVVALSADARASGIAAARSAGADDYWTKPLDFAHFERGLRALLTP